MPVTLTFSEGTNLHITKGKRNFFQVYFKKFHRRNGLESGITAKNIQPSCHLNVGVIHKDPWGPAFPSSHLRGCQLWLAYSLLPLCPEIFQTLLGLYKIKLRKERRSWKRKMWWVGEGFQYHRHIGMWQKYAEKGKTEYFERVLRPIYGFWNRQEKD